jgi:predicted CoA-binding protein
MSNKKTLVLGASSNEERYSYKAVTKLLAHGYEVIPLGIKAGKIGETEILTERKIYPDIHTVSLYIGPNNQKEWFDYILSLHPKRIIFNPGTENLEFQNLAEQNGVEAIEACTLVLLSIGNY